jgi:hypothetical protein
VTLRRALLAALIVFLVVVAIVDVGWLPAAVLGAVIVAGVPYAVGALAQGQTEWFGREQERRKRR